MSTDSQQLQSPPIILPYPEFRELTLKQKSFADNWLQCRNGRLAASLAGYDGNDDTLRAVASENLAKPNVSAYIKAQLEERHLNTEQVLAELGDIASYSLDSIAIEGSPVKTQDKIKALELVGKYLKLWADRAEPSTDLTTMLPQLVTLLQEARLAGQRARAIEAECVGQQDVMAELATDNNQE